MIDSNRELTVGRAMKLQNTYKTVFADHFTCILTLKDLPTVQNAKSEKTAIWN